MILGEQLNNAREMKTRSLATLYSLAYDYVKDEPDRSQNLNGLCHLFFRMQTQGIVTWEEHMLMCNNLANNKPSGRIHIRFALDDLFTDDTVYWFPVGNWIIRKEFLLMMIEYSKPWYVKMYEEWRKKLSRGKISPDT